MMALSEMTGVKYGDIPAAAKDYVDIEREILDMKTIWEPYTKMLDSLETQPALSIQYTWPLANTNPMILTISSHGSNNVLSFSAASGIYGIHPGMTLFSEDGGAADWMIVDAVDTSGYTVTAYNYAGTDKIGTAGNYAAGSKFMVMGTSQGEGGRAGRIKYTYTTAYNYLQSFSKQMNRSDIVGLLQDRFSDEKFQKTKLMTQFLKELELAYLLGKRATITSYSGTGRPADGKHWMTGGIFTFTPDAQIYPYGTSEFDMVKWRSYLSKVVKNGEGPKVIYTGLEGYNEVWKVYRKEGVQLTPQELSFEIDSPGYKGHKCSLEIHPGLNDSDYERYFFGYDKEYVKQKIAMDISVRKIPMDEYDQDRYKVKTIRGLKPMSTDVLHILKITT
jgi:hypothetical protein